MTTTTALQCEPKLFAKAYALTSIGAILLISMLAFESMAISAVMPAVAKALQAFNWYSLAFAGQLATSIIGMIVAGDCCDRYGTRLTNLTGTSIFTLGLLLAGCASNMPVLIIGRIIQGLGAGMLGVAIYVSVAQCIPAQLHPQLFALFASAWVIPALVGPTIAVALVELLGWRSVFLVVAVLAPFACALLLSNQRNQARPTLTVTPSPMRWQIWSWSITAAITVLLLNLWPKYGPKQGHLTGLLLVVGLCLIASYKLLPDGSLSMRRGLPAVITLRGLLASAFFCVEVYLPLLLTQQFDWSLYQAGLVLSSGAIAWTIGSAMQAKFITPNSRPHGLRTGFALLSLGNLGVLLAAYFAAPVLLCLSWFASGLGIGLAFPILSVLTINYSSDAEQGKNTSALQISDALSTSLVLGLCSNLITFTQHIQRTHFLMIIGVCCMLAAISLLCSTRAASVLATQ